MKLCNCGCGIFIPMLTKRGKLSQLMHHHYLKGEKNFNWKGGALTDSLGYIRDYSPQHPKCTNAGYVYRHRLVMEKYLGRYLD